MNEDSRNFSILPEIDLNSTPHFEETNHNISHHSFDLNSNPPNEDESDNQESEDEFVNQEIEDLLLLLGASSSVIGIKSKANLRDDMRTRIFDATLARSKDLKLPNGVTNTIAELFSVNVRTVRRIWKRGRDCLLRNEVVDVCSRKPKNCGRKGVRTSIDSSAIMALSLSKRSTMRDMAASLKVGKHTIENLFKSGEIRRHTNCIKPLLTERNKKARLEWCLSMLDPRTIPHNPTFKSMFDVVFIDEKWFYLTERNKNYYLCREEEEPLRTCKNANFIGKVMFLTAVARLRMDENGNCIFDGKIGCFPFVNQVEARRNSVNRAAGTLEMKSITSINKDVVRTYLIEKVLPAIRAKWPREDVHSTIYIQQDNAPTHIDPNDLQFCEVSKQDGFDIRLICQPPNSPDLNVLDLGFFRSIQSIQYKECPKSIAELVEVVEKAFEEFSPILSNRIFLTLQSCMIEIMKARGSNHYKIPHLKKGMLEREEHLPLNLKCDQELVNDVFRLVIDA